jgi:hypothetical protein
MPVYKNRQQPNVTLAYMATAEYRAWRDALADKILAEYEQAGNATGANNPQNNVDEIPR